MPHDSQTRRDELLEDFAASYSPGEFFADMVSPIHEASAPAGDYYVHKRSDTETPESDLLSARAKANQVNYEVAKQVFKCTDRGLEGLVPVAQAERAANPLQIRRNTQRKVLNTLFLNRERRIAAIFNNNANYAAGHTFAAAGLWSAGASVPLDDIDAAKELLPPGEPDANSMLVMLVTLEVWNALRKHQSLIGGGAVRPILSQSEVAELLGVDRILVSSAQVSVGGTRSRIWDPTKCYLTRAFERGQARDMTEAEGVFCATFRERRAGRQAIRTNTWHDPSIGTDGADMIKTVFADDEVIIQNDMAVRIDTVLS